MYFSRKFLNAITPVVVMLVVSLLLQAFSLQPAKALSGSEFQAGRIIDDVVFNDKGRMNSSQIQEFLNAKLPVCDTNGTQMYNSTQTRAQWAAANGRPLPPYTCLKDYSQSVPGVVNGGSDLCKSSIAGGVKSAAQIIYDVAQACSVNPQVLIVLLQKEQSLITDSWPWPTQYQAATGYGCPDTAPCDAEFYGFFNQVYQAAKAFRRYEANPNSYNYKANRNNYIYYHPSLGACGGTNVFIQNQATASLYIYTPYQPNAAALNNLYGTGDGCSAYGNRNFWRMFNDWFGSTFAPDWNWQPVSQKIFNNVEKTWVADPTNLWPNRRYRVEIVARNTGNQVWNKGTVNLGTNRPLDRASAFCDSSWLNNVGCNRVISLKETSVAPGQNGTFEFWIKTPMVGGSYNEYFNPVADGYSWLNDQGLYWTFTVREPSLQWSVVSQQAFTDQTKTVPTNYHFVQGERMYMQLKVRNNGNLTWRQGEQPAVRLGTSNPIDRRSPFCDSSWLNLNCDRVANHQEAVVEPGEVATFEFWVKAPTNTSGVFNEYYRLVADGYRWMEDIGLYWTYHVHAQIYQWQPISQAAFTDNTKTVPSNLVLTPGQEAYLTLRAINTGNMTWTSSAVPQIRLSTSSPMDRRSLFCTSSWLNLDCNRLANLKEASVPPGSIGTFEFLIKAPATSGTYNEYYSLSADGLRWLNDPGLYWTIVVN